MNDDPVQVIHRLARHYRELREIEGRLDAATTGPALPDLQTTIVTVQRGDAIEAGTTPGKGAWAQARALAQGLAGWARRRSGLWWSVTGEDDWEDETLGPPLYGEWVTDDGSESFHLRPDATEPGRLRLWTYLERPLTDGDDSVRHDEFAALCQEVQVITPPRDEREAAAWKERDEKSNRNDPILRRVAIYRVYWAGVGPLRSSDAREEDEGSEENGDPYAIRRILTRFVGFAEDRDVRVMPESPRPSRKMRAVAEESAS